jgi:hypothetical protein
VTTLHASILPYRFREETSLLENPKRLVRVLALLLTAGLFGSTIGWTSTNYVAFPAPVKLYEARVESIIVSRTVAEGLKTYIIEATSPKLVISWHFGNDRLAAERAATMAGILTRIPPNSVTNLHRDFSREGREARVEILYQTDSELVQASIWAATGDELGIMSDFLAQKLREAMSDLFPQNAHVLEFRSRIYQPEINAVAERETLLDWKIRWLEGLLDEKNVMREPELPVSVWKTRVEESITTNFPRYSPQTAVTVQEGGVFFSGRTFEGLNVKIRGRSSESVMQSLDVIWEDIERVGIIQDSQRIGDQIVVVRTLGPASVVVQSLQSNFSRLFIAVYGGFLGLLSGSLFLIWRTLSRGSG